MALDADTGRPAPVAPLTPPDTAEAENRFREAEQRKEARLARKRSLQASNLDENGKDNGLGFRLVPPPFDYKPPALSM